MSTLPTDVFTEKKFAKARTEATFQQPATILLSGMW